MGQEINLCSTGLEIDLELREYKVDVLGGWGVKLNQFNISFNNVRSGNTIYCSHSIWPVQSVVSGKRSKRIFVFDVLEPGTYKINFIYPEALEVKHSSLFFTALFQPVIPNTEISIYIY